MLISLVNVTGVRSNRSLADILTVKRVLSRSLRRSLRAIYVMCMHVLSGVCAALEGSQGDHAIFHHNV